MGGGEAAVVDRHERQRLRLSIWNARYLERQSSKLRLRSRMGFIRSNPEYRKIPAIKGSKRA
jgi:hypothetical protein